MASGNATINQRRDGLLQPAYSDSTPIILISGLQRFDPKQVLGGPVPGRSYIRAMPDEIHGTTNVFDEASDFGLVSLAVHNNYHHCAKADGDA
jgi:hypothetical protein